MEVDAEGAKGTSERYVDFLTVAVDCTDTVLVGVVGGGDDVL